MKLSRLVLTGLCFAAMACPGVAQASIPFQVDFWSFLADRDYVVIAEVTSAQELREGPKRCGILHNASVVKTIKGNDLGRTIQFVSAGDVGVGTKAVFLLSNSESLGRKRDWVLDTTCVRNPYRWYFGRFASDHVLPFAKALSAILKTDVVEIQGNGFLVDPSFIQDDVQIEGGKRPLFVRDFHQGDGHFVMLAKIEAAVQAKGR